MAYALAGKRVLVTGASSGIGAGLAERFAAAGATVGISARREDRLREVLANCQKHSPECRMWTADLSDFAEVDRLAETALAELGGIDVLVNNAGIPLRRHVTELDAATIESVMRINYLSPVRLTLAVLPQMLERDEGRIINVASVAATLSSPGESAYDASKAALSVFSEAASIDLAETGVKVTIVYPAIIDTEMFGYPDTDPMHHGLDKLPVSDVVEAVLRGVQEDALQVYVPSWFADMAAGKAANVEEFLAGAAKFVREQHAAYAQAHGQEQAPEDLRA